MKARIYAFDEVDRPEEVAAALTGLRQEMVNEVEALRTELAGCVRKKPKKPKKGFVMKNVLISIAVISVILGSVAHGQFIKSDINYDIVSNPESLSQWLRDVVASGTFEYTPIAAPTNNDIIEGKVYYDISSKALFVSLNGTTWTQLDTAGGTSLDASYNLGITISVDAGAVAMTATNAADNVVLALAQSDTGTTKAFTITNAGTGNTIDIQGQGASNDIEGTGDTWGVTSAGVATLVGLVTSTGDVTFTGANYDIIHDASADQLEFQDNAELSFGTDEDVEIAYDNTSLNILADDKSIRFGADGAGPDVVFFSEAASSKATFTEATDDLLLVAYDVDFDDNSNLVIGSGDEWNIDNAAENLRFIPSDTDDDFVVAFGNATNTTDLLWYTKTASSIITIDASADIMDFDGIDLRFDDGDFLKFGDSSDFTVTSDGTAVLKIATLATDESPIIHIGANTAGSDMRFYPVTTAEYMEWDAGNEALEFVGTEAHFDDASTIEIGSDKDFTILSSTTKELQISALGADELYSVHIGIDQAGVDLSLHGTTASDILLWDASDDYLHMIGDKVLFTLAEAGAANVFKVDATGAAGSEIDLIVLETSDGGIMVDADGVANGDIELNAADDMTLTAAGDLTFAVTGTFGLGGSLLTNTGIVTENVTGATDTLTAAQSGSIIVYTMTGAACEATLPAAAAGLWFVLVDGNPAAGRDLKITPVGDDGINGDAATNYILNENDRDGEGVVIFATSSTTWFMMAGGTSTVWTEE